MKPLDLAHLDQIPELTLISASSRQAAKNGGGSSRDHWFVDRSQIRVMDGFNVRIKNQSYAQYVRWLADQMKQVGFRVDKSLSCYAAKDAEGRPILYVTDGHTRLDAYDLATSEGCDLGQIPVALGQELQNQNIEDLTVGLVTTNSGRELTALEKAAVYKRLINFRWTEASIAERLGVTSQHVQNMLILASAPPQIRQMVANEEVSASMAIETIRTHGVEAVARLTAALEGARQAGQSKATKKHLVDPSHRAAKRQAPALLATIKHVQSDPGFPSLSQETQATLIRLLETIENATKRARPATSSGSGEEDVSPGAAQGQGQGNLDLP
ncbi:MAG: hypothetical protein KGZ70_13785 [Hydrogenophaga sp.]|nr:hypothetical protein [Hydrogenophaga sp.]